MLYSGSWTARRAQTEGITHSEWEDVPYPGPSATSISLPLPNDPRLKNDMRRPGRKSSDHWHRRLFSPRKKGPTTLSAIAAVHRVASMATLVSGPETCQTIDQPSYHESSGLEVGPLGKIFAEPMSIAHFPTDGDNQSPNCLVASRMSEDRTIPSNVLPTPTPRLTRPSNIHVAQPRNTSSVTMQDGFTQTVVLYPPIPQSDSPMPLTQGTQSDGHTYMPDSSGQERLSTIMNEVSSLDIMISSIFSAVDAPTKGTNTTIGSWKTAEDGGCERKLLIIGSRYSNSPGKRSRSAFESCFQPLSGVTKDTSDLRSVFRRRGYSVETLVEEDFDRQTALDRVAEFLKHAVSGDVRAIIFTGHAVKLGQTADLIPPLCQNGNLTDFIPAEVWSENIRRHTRAGVIVLSIFASCFSGALMQQSVTLTDFSGSMDVPGAFNAFSTLESSNTANPIQPQTPIFITFSSSSHDEQSHEAGVLHHDPTVRDYFLYALAATARDTNVKDWADFIHTLRTTFSHARSIGALWGELEGGEASLSWLLANPQTPQFTISQAGLPRFEHLLPPMECRQISTNEFSLESRDISTSVS